MSAHLFLHSTDWQDDWMTGKRFQPDIKRNRLFTNWVVASSGIKTSHKGPTSRVKWRARFLVTGAVMAAMGLIFAVQAPHESPRASTATEKLESGTPTSTNRPTNTNHAQEECSASALGKLLATKIERGSVDLFVQIATTSLGGIRIEKYRCRSGSATVEFSAEWTELDSKWELKKISQLPRG